MSVQNLIGDAFRGATMVALHNGGGVGFGEAINGGFMLVLDGSQACFVPCSYMPLLVISMILIYVLILFPFIML